MHTALNHAISLTLSSSINPAISYATPIPQIDKRLIKGVAIGLAAASIGALYTVFARWGIAHGMDSADMTFLRFGVAGLATLPVLGLALMRDWQGVASRWRAWLLISLLAGPLFGLLMFTALQWAPANHAAVFPFTSMSIMGMLLSAWILKDKLTVRKVVGISVVVAGLVTLSGLSLHSMTPQTIIGDLLFIAAGTLWAGFGIVMRRERLDPLLATAVVSFAALVTYVPAYLVINGTARLLATAPAVVWTEVLVQGLIAGAGTLYTYSKMVAILGPGRAAIFPALAPGLAALLAWPVLGHQPTGIETVGLVVVIVGLLVAVTTAAKPVAKLAAA
jgi:drug/metabolite transporter (DMT)-like permease